MWEEDWARLGIGPTTELGAIKKAYALKLRVTRPDDDAEAYQALRAAYERVQQWVKWQLAQPPAEAQELPAPTADVEAAPPATAVQTEDADASWLAAHPDPQSCIDELHALWQQQGPDALVAQWPQTRALLEAQPLSQRAATSARFAHWVLQHHTLPDALVAQLIAYFDWLGDFRVERQLGPDLARALQVTLHERMVIVRPPSAEEQDLAKPLLQFKRLRQQGRGRLSLLLGLALQPLLARLLQSLNPRTLGQLGLDLHDRRQLDQLGNAAWVSRAAAFLALAAAIFAIRSPHLPAPGELLFFWGLASIVWLGASYYLGMFMNFGFSLLGQGEAPLARPLARWRRHRRQPVAGLVLLAAAALLGAASDRFIAATTPLTASEHLQALAGWGWSMLPWLLGLIGALLAWPLTPVVGTLSMGLSMPCFAGLAYTELAPWSCCAAGSLFYVLMGAARFEGRLATGGAATWLFQPVINTLAMGSRWGWRFGLLPGLLALALVCGRSDGGAWLSTLPIWIAATLALGGAQRRFEAWALARLSRA